MKQSRTIFFINFKILFFLSILFNHNILFAQDTEKKYSDTSYWTFWNFDYQLANNDSLFFEINTRSSAFNSYLIDGLNINRAHLMLGYAHKFKNPKFIVGASVRSVFEEKWNVWYYRGFFQHNGVIGGDLLEFHKRLSYEYIDPIKTEDTPGSRESYGRFGVWLMLGRNFNLGTAKFRGEFSYEFFMHQNDQSAEERVVDLSRLRFDLYWVLSENIRLGVFALRDTQFYFAPATGPRYDADGNLISEGKPERNLNIITPTYGFTFKYSIRQKGECNCPGEKRRR